MTRVRMVCSVADAGKEERNNDIWSWMCGWEMVLLFERGTHHRFIFWEFEALVLRMSSQNFARDRIIFPKISVLNVLLRQLVIHWHLVTEYGEDGDKQISLHKSEGGREINTHR
jgi:hypothetical protein